MTTIYYLCLLLEMTNNEIFVLQWIGSDQFSLKFLSLHSEFGEDHEIYYNLNFSTVVIF